jgi:hypothetical protein
MHMCLNRYICYDLCMKYLAQAAVLNIWSPAGGAILGDGGTFRRWDLASGDMLLKVMPGLLPSSLSASYPT